MHLPKQGVAATGHSYGANGGSGGGGAGDGRGGLIGGGEGDTAAQTQPEQSHAYIQVRTEHE